MNENIESFDLMPSVSLLELDVCDDNFSAPEQITRRDVAKSFYLLGKLHYDKSDFNEAERNFLKALEIVERPIDDFTIFKTLGFLIRVASENLDDVKANKYIKQAEDVILELESALATLNAEYFYCVGILNNYKGDFEAAKENFLICYRKSKEENEPELLAKCLLALAINLFNVEKYDPALDYLHQLNQLLKIIDKSYLLGSMYFFSGKIYTGLGRYDDALKFFQKANKHLQEKKCWNLYGYILLWKGIVFKKTGDFAKSMWYLETGVESIDNGTFKRLSSLLRDEIADVNDSNVDIYFDRENRKIFEKRLGEIDFKHRFVLLEILFLLARNPGEYYDKEKLAKEIWKDEYNPLIHDKLIYTSVSRLRKLVEPKNRRGEKRKYIIRGKDGYAFCPLAKARFHIENRQATGHAIANVELSSPV